MVARKLNIYTFSLKDKRNSWKQVVLAYSYDAALHGLGLLEGISIKLCKNNPLSELKNVISRSNNFKKELSEVFFGIARCIKAGVSLPNAIKISAALVSNPKIKGVLGELYVLTGKEGYSFSESMGKFPEVFTSMNVAIVQAGEKTGKISEVLMDLGRRMEKADRTVNNLKASLYYPGFVIAITIIAFFLVVYFILPQMKQNFDSFNVALPALTKCYMKVGEFLHLHYLSIPIVFTVVISLYYFGKVFLKSQYFQRKLLSVPIIGDLNHCVILSRSLQALGMMIQSGADILASMQMAKSVSGNIVYEEYFEGIYKNLKNGKEPNIAFMEEGYRIGKRGYLIANQIRLSSFGGDMHVFLNELSKTLEEEVEIKTRELPKLVQPILMLFISLAIGSLIAAIYLPTFELLQGVMR